MPRIDNSPDSIEGASYVIWTNFPNQYYQYDPEDPGKTPPIDLCYECWENALVEFEIDHPPYEENKYTCALCGQELDAEDD